MDVNIFKNPTVIRINNVFSEEKCDEIFQEALKNKKYFNTAKIGEDNKGKIDKDVRNNLSAFYDNIYNINRNDSALLTAINDVFRDSSFVQMMNSLPDPFNKFVFTNVHETQVSRYGDSGQKYNYHVDFIGSSDRMFTLVYYFGNDKFEGGEIEFVDSPIVNGEALVKDANTHKIKPKRNEGYIFSANTGHRVCETRSPETFEDGRFSVNCWLGVKH
jgi:Rps23 Pro-64 3,4-dihydroxylase Tpa1-like proline 4-hydroxylase